MDEQLKFLALVVERLEVISIPYMVTGSVAMAVYSEPRMTRDIDLVAAIQPDDVDRLVAALAPDCYVDADAVRSALRHESMFNVIHKDWAAKIDFIIRKNHIYRKTEFERRRRAQIDDVSFDVVSIEDLVLSKLTWRKNSHSELQLRDVRALLKSRHQVDRDYLRKWAVELGVDKDLKEADSNG